MSNPNVYPSSISASPGNAVIEIENLSISYGKQTILKNVNLSICAGELTGLIGPSGCGKSSLLRSLNRLLDTVPGANVQGKIRLHGTDIQTIPPSILRRRIGMVFQQPNPFPKSIYENIALGLRVNGCRQNIDHIVETVLQQVGLWEEVKADLGKNAMYLSGGQQQRLCIARALALQPEILLMDEPCGALDPISADRVSHLLNSLKTKYTLIIVTHDLRQAARITDRLAFFNFTSEGDRLVGQLVEYGETPQLYGNAKTSATHNYIHYGQQPIYSGSQKP